MLMAANPDQTYKTFMVGTVSSLQICNFLYNTLQMQTPKGYEYEYTDVTSFCWF